MAALKEKQQQISRKLNKKVMAMFEKCDLIYLVSLPAVTNILALCVRAESEYKDLLAKKAIIENDKDKISSVIAELDEKKNEALKKTWAKVNKYAQKLLR